MRVASPGRSVTGMLILMVAVTQAASVSRQQADSFAKKIALIQQHGTRASTGTVRTTVSESELNSWFTYDASSSLPTGVTAPRITMNGDRTLTGVATVDLDAMAKSRASGSAFDVWNFIGGRVPVTVMGRLHARGGRVRFELLEANIARVPVPRRVVEELVDYYSRTPDHPRGVRLDQEFELPARIQQIEINPGAAIVVQ